MLRLVNSIVLQIFSISDSTMAATGPYNYSYIFKYIIIGKYSHFAGKTTFHCRDLKLW